MATSTIGDIGRGLVSGLVSVPEGITTLGTGVYDYLFDQNVTDEVIDFYERFKPETETAAGATTKFLAQFGIPGIGVASALSKLGKASKLQSTIGLGLTDLAVATDDAESIGNLIFERETLQDRLDGLNGRNAAEQRLLNRLMIGSESAAIVAAAPVVLGAIGSGVGKTLSKAGETEMARQMGKGMIDMGSEIGKWTTKEGTRRGKFFDASGKWFTSKYLNPNQLAFQLQQLKLGEVAGRTEMVEGAFAGVSSVLRAMKKQGYVSPQEEKVLGRKVSEYLFPEEAALNIWTKEGRVVPKSGSEGMAAYQQQIRSIQDSAAKYLKETDESYGALGFKAIGKEGEPITLFNSLEPVRYEMSRLGQQLGGEKTTIKSGIRKGKDEPGLDPDSIFLPKAYKDMVEDMHGFYGTRAYRALREVDYQPTAAQKEVALKEIEKNVVLLDNPELAAKLSSADPVVVAEGRNEVRVSAENIWNQLMGDNSQITNLASMSPEFMTEGIKTGMLKGRTLNSLPDVRKALGEIESVTGLPDANLKTTITMSHLANLVGSAKFFDDLVRLNNSADKMGIDKFLYRSGEKAGTVPFNGKQFGKLNALGLEADPDIVKGITGASEDWLRNGGWLANLYTPFLAAKGASQLAKTVYSPITQIRNASTASFFALMNGNVGRNGNIVEAADAMFGRISNLGRAEQKELSQKLLDLNVINSSAAFNEIRALLGDSGGFYTRNMSKVPGGKSVMKFARDRQNDLASKLYVASDDVWKYYGWEHEVAKLTKALDLHPERLVDVRHIKNLEALEKANVLEAGGKVTGQNFRRVLGKEGIEREAGDIVADTVPNYSRVPEAIKRARLLPLGNFIAFPAEIFRTTGNVLGLAAKELASDNPLIRASGMRRLTGALTVTTALPTGAAALGSALTGANQEQIDAYRRSFAAPWDKAATLVPLATDPAGNVTEFFNFSYTNPYDYLQRPIRAMLNAYSNGVRDEESYLKIAGTAGTDALEEMFQPFAAPSIVTQATMDLFKNETPTGRRIVNPADPLGLKFMKQFLHLAESFVPNAVPFELRADATGGPLYLSMEAKDLPRAVLVGTGLTGDDPGITRAGKKLDMADELTQGFSGIRTIKPQVARSMRYRGFEANDDIRNSSRIFNSFVRQAGQMDPEDATKAYIAANEARFKSLRDLSTSIQDARTLGLADWEIDRELKTAKVANRSAVMSNRYLPFFPSNDVLSDIVRSDKNKVSNQVPWNAMLDLYTSKVMKPLTPPREPSQYFFEDWERTPRPAPRAQAPQSAAAIALRQKELEKLMGLG